MTEFPAGVTIPLGYRVVRTLARLLMRIFYGRIDVIGLEHVPSHGPLVVVANHQNALVDPMLLLATLPRRLVPIAKAPLFHSPLFAPFLRLAGAIPAHRRQDEPDAGLDPNRNTAMFASATAALRDGRAILIFPEGVSQAEPRLMPLRTGAARLVLAAELPERVAILPVGLVFDDPGRFRTGRALVLVGAPLAMRDLRGSALPDGLFQDSSGSARLRLRLAPPSEEQIRQLTADIGTAIRRQIVEARDRDTYRLLQLAEAVWAAETGAEHRDPGRRTAWRQLALRAHDFLAATASERLQALRSDLEEFAEDLEAAGLSGKTLVEAYPARAVLRYARREGASLVVGFPLALWGMVVHALPYQLTALVTRLVRPSADTEATFKIFAGLVLYPLCWIAEGWLVWRVGGPWRLAVFIVTLLPTGVLALTWRERWDRVRRDVRAFVQFLRDRDLHRRLLARRQALAEKMEALARLVPPPVLDAGRQP
jgi:glycerol-3-phosphate O-acyltransferase/dihydroxyacetone phosphate acyltransferase